MEKKDKKGRSAPESRITDERFASFETDPRFRLPSKKYAKTTVDKRFAGMLKDNEFTGTSRVDRYGRKIKSDSKKKALERLYQIEDEDKVEDSAGRSESEGEGQKQQGEEEGESEDEDEDKDDIDPDDVVQREKKYDPARGGGFSSSESDSDSSDEEESEAAEVAIGGIQRFQDEQADVEVGEVTNRIAVVNLDWDHVKSVDLMALFSSFLPNEDGKVDKVSVYPSEFGKERMQQEEMEGPPKALFKKQKKKGNDSSDDSGDDSDDDDDDEKIKEELIQEGNDEDYNSDALRAYQLDRLRYYYAIVTCSSPQAAKKIYDTTDGTEYLSSSNFLDLRFVPDDVAFDDEPRDECDTVPESYKPVEFITDALQSSKVKLTWDMHPEEASRKDSIKRAFTGSRNDIEENDLKTYLASESDDDDDDDKDADGDHADEVRGVEEGEAQKLSKKELARKKMRQALGLADKPASKSKDAPVGGMEITFTPALSGDSKSKRPEAEETTIEKYKRKERERKEKKRQATKAKRQGVQDEEEASDAEVAGGGTEDLDDKDLGFDDPFFTTAGGDIPPPSKTAQRKEERLKKRAAKDAQAAADAAEKARLQHIMAENNDDGAAAHLDHFDMADIVRAEKHKSKKGKQAKQKAADISARGKLQQSFQMDVNDNRFTAVFDSHEYAIDPSNAKYKATEGMKKILEEGRRKRHGDGGACSRPAKKTKK